MNLQSTKFMRSNFRYSHEARSESQLNSQNQHLATTRFGLYCSDRKNKVGELPPGFEVALVAEDAAASFEKAIASGATSVNMHEPTPGGQIVAYLLAPNSIPIEICSPVE